MSFQPVTRDDVLRLTEIVGAKALLQRESIPEEFTHDEMAPVSAWPDVLVRPSTTEQVSGVLRHCSERCIPVTPRGSGTGLMGGAVAVRGGILMDLSVMKDIVEIDPANMVARVQPGVTLMELSEAVEAEGLFYAPDPGEKSGSIGGNVNTNAGGMRAVKYGVTRDHIRGMEVVLSGGDVLRLGGRVAKNSTGYQLMHLIIGSEGTLAVVTEITVRLLPKPPLLSSLLVPFESLEEAIGTVPKFAEAGIMPQAVEFMRRGVIEASEKYLGKPFPDSSAPAYLLLRFDGTSSEELAAQMEAAAHLCLHEGALDALIADTAERQDALWDARGAFIEAIKTDNEIDECDVVVPRARIPEMVLHADRVSAEVGIRLESFGHAGDGNIHIFMVRDGLCEQEWGRRKGRTMDMLYEEAARLGGLVSGEHGIGHSRRSHFRHYTDDVQLELMRGIKDIFDPAGILNPDKIL